MFFGVKGQYFVNVVCFVEWKQKVFGVKVVIELLVCVGFCDFIDCIDYVRVVCGFYIDVDDYFGDIMGKFKVVGYKGEYLFEFNVFVVVQGCVQFYIVFGKD